MSEYGLDKTKHPNERVDDIGSQEDFGYFLAFTWGENDQKILWVNWFLFDIQGRDDGGKPYFAKPGCTSLPATGNDIIFEWREGEPDASDFVKWDSCSQ